jgi:LysM repeat protein
MMMKQILILFLGLVAGSMAMQAQAQTGVITHTIRQGETLSGLSAKYKTTVGDIMRLNNMTATSKLAIGQKVKIPATGTKVPAATTAPAPVAAKPVKAPPTKLVPVTEHTVKKGETLYKIAQTYHVKIDQVKTWNHLTGDGVAVGQVLSIGADAPAGGNPLPPVQHQAKAVEPLPEQTAATPAPKPVTPVTRPEETAPAPVVTPKPPVNTPSTPMVNKEEVSVDASKVGPKGYFESLFGVDVVGRSLEKSSGTAMTFKTASGWTDKKYYILVNDIAPGSIVKITSADGKVIYAKVLWNMGDLKENEGLTYRISNAAADALGIADMKFQLTIAYYD